MRQAGDIAPCPVTVSVNLDVETFDARSAGAAGLFGRYSYGRYSAREGLWRLLNLFNEHAIRATFFVSADDAGRHGGLLEAVLNGGHEVAAQGEPIDERKPLSARLEILEKSRNVVASVTGRAPTGWRSSNGLLTRETLLELSQLGYTYDSSFQDDDHPYVFDCGNGRKLAELPVFDYLTDSTFYSGRHTPHRVRTVWFEEFEAMRAAGSYLHLVLHSRGDIGSGRAVRARVVADFLAYISKQPGVRFYRCDEIAALYASQRAAEPIPNWPMG